jgi:predicted nuclease of predicted toxin-antitoxin system
MRVLFDQNLSPRLVELLSEDYPGCQHVHTIGLAGADDQTVWDYAAQLQLVIVSKDSDFQHRALLYGPPPKVVWLRVGNGPTNSVVALLRSRKQDIAAFVLDPSGHFSFCHRGPIARAGHASK